MRKLIKQRGFTLVETTLYFAVVGTFLLAATMFSLQILNVFKISENSQEIQANLVGPLDRIAGAIKSADSIVDGNSVFDSDNGILALDIDGIQTRFYLNGGALYMQEGAATAIKLTSENVTVPVLRFHKIEALKTPTQITIDGRIETVSTAAGLDKNLPFHLSASLRKL
jgi:hypothetical protein